MRWYSLLPSIPEKQARDSNSSSRLLEALNDRIVDLYGAVLLYLMQLVCSLWQIDDFYLWRRLQSRTVTLETIKQAERDLQLLDENWIQKPLRKLLAATRTESANLDREQDSLPEETRELLEDLHVVDPRPGLSRIIREQNSSMQQLYLWLLSTEKYKQFLDWNPIYNKVLWMTSEAGQGKTLLLTSVVQALWGRKQADEKKFCLAFFFFDYSHPQYDNIAAALKNLIWFLLHQQPSLTRYLKRKCKATERKHFDDPNDFPALSNIFFDMLGDETFPNVYFIVDALDEASYNDNTSEIQEFLDLISLSTKSSEKIKWLISSNNSEKMKRVFEGLTNSHLDLGADMSTKAAIDTYIQERVSDLATDKAYDDELKDIITRELCKVSSGNYLWVDIVCTALRDEDIWHIEDFLKVLSEKPTLRGLYRFMGNRIQDLPWDRKFCIEVLRVMGVVQHSLQIGELESLVRLAPRVNLKVILQKCSAFLRISQDLVSFRNQSAREYVRERFLGNTTILEFHAALTSRCLETLAKHLPSKSTGQPGGITTAQIGQLRTTADWNYALLHWITHLHEICKALGNRTLREKMRWGVTWRNVQNFLQNHFIPWVDILLRENKLSSATAQLQMVDLCLEERASNPTLLLFFI